MSASKKVVSVAVSLALLTVVLMSLSTPLAYADSAHIRVLKRATLSSDGTTLTFTAILTLHDQDNWQGQHQVPDGTVIGIHFDTYVAPVKNTPNKPGAHVYGGDLSVTITDDRTWIPLAFPYGGPGYYLVVVSAYLPNGNLLATGWVDPKEGTGG